MPVTKGHETCGHTFFMMWCYDTGQCYANLFYVDRVKRIRYLSPMRAAKVQVACASAQSRQNLRCSLIQAVSQEEPSDRKPDPWPLWMAGHAQLKFVMTECSKTQIRLTRLMSSVLNLILYEPHQGKTRLLRLRPGKTQTCMDQLASFNFYLASIDIAFKAVKNKDTHQTPEMRVCFLMMWLMFFWKEQIHHKMYHFVLLNCFMSPVLHRVTLEMMCFIFWWWSLVK